jgi:hypothetical protein
MSFQVLFYEFQPRRLSTAQAGASARFSRFVPTGPTVLLTFCLTVASTQFAGSVSSAPPPAGHLCLPNALLTLSPGVHATYLGFRRWQYLARLHRAVFPPARISPASDA